MASPFVRVGAVVDCARCRHRYRIADNHVKWKASTAAAAEEAGEALVAQDEDTQSAIEALARTADGQVIGLSGLSEVMRREPGIPAAAGPPIPMATSTDERQRIGQAARSKARRRDAHLLYLLIGGLVLALGLVGGVLWYVMLAGRPASPAASPATPSTSTDRVPGGDGAESVDAADAGSFSSVSPGTDGALPLVEAESASIQPWKPVQSDQPHDFHYLRREAWLIDEARVFTEQAEEHFVADVVTGLRGVVVEAVVHLVLVGGDDRAVAQATVPVALFGQGRRQAVRIPIPEPLTDALRIDSWVDISARMPQGVYLNQTSAAVVEMPDPAGDDPGRGAVLQVEAVNPSDRTLKQMVVIVTARNDRGRAIGRWRIEVEQPVEARQKAQFRVAVPRAPVEAVRYWSVEAAGE